MNAGTYISLALHGRYFGCCFVWDWSLKLSLQSDLLQMCLLFLLQTMIYSLKNVQPNLPLAPDALFPTPKIPDSLPFCASYT